MKIRNWFKKKPKEHPYNINHPDVAGNIEFAFECAGVKYYRAIQEFRLPVGRYKWVDTFLFDAQLRMDYKTLNAYLDKLDSILSGERGTIHIGKAWELVQAMKTRTRDLAWEPASIKRLASVVYFDSTENLLDYDREHCEKKIKFWEENDCYDFFLTRPIEELCNLKDISVDSLKTYIQEAELILRDLTSEIETPL